MKLNLNCRRKWLIGAGVLALAATPSFALFGVGDVVFDPTSYASLVSQLTTLQTQYNMLKNNITHFSFKQQWQTSLTALKSANVANMFGETAGLNVALNTNSPNASVTGWKAGTVAVNSDTSGYLAGQNLGSDRISQLAMVEMSDSISPDCLTAIGQYRGARTQNANANGSLAAHQLDSTDGTNTEVEQLNLLNAAEAQRLSEMQSQGTLQSPTCSSGTRPLRTSTRRRWCNSNVRPTTPVRATRARPGRPTFPKGAVHVERDQHQASARDPGGAGRHRKRRSLPTPSVR